MDGFNKKVQVGINETYGGTYYHYFERVGYIEFEHDNFDADSTAMLQIVHKTDGGGIVVERFRSEKVESIKMYI